MAKYVVTKRNGGADVVCNSRDEALHVEGYESIYCAPDAEKTWTKYPAAPIDMNCFVLYMGIPVRAKSCYGISGHIYELTGMNNKMVFERLPWLPLDWYRYVPADDEDMYYWQQEDE